MTIGQSIRALHESAIVQRVNIESLHASMAGLQASIARQSENIDSLVVSFRNVLDSINKLALISQSHHQPISTLESHPQPS